MATTMVQGDLRCIERGLYEGLLVPWAACNFGTGALAPRRTYLIPDSDEDAVRESFAKRSQAFLADVKGYGENGFEITQAFIDMLADKHGIPAPRLALTVAIPAGSAGPAQGTAALPAEDIDGDGAPDDPPSNESATRLAKKMTDLQIPACEHGRKNRCPLCGVERQRDVEMDENGEPIWKLAWKPIGAPDTAPAEPAEAA